MPVHARHGQTMGPTWSVQYVSPARIDPHARLDAIQGRLGQVGARAREVAAYRQSEALKRRTVQAPVSLEGMFEALADKARSWLAGGKGD